jgi:hypothetical protein
MKPLFARVRAAGVLAAGLLLSTPRAEAAFFPRLGITMQSVVSPVQYRPWEERFSPGRPTMRPEHGRCRAGLPAKALSPTSRGSGQGLDHEAGDYG